MKKRIMNLILAAFALSLAGGTVSASDKMTAEDITAEELVAATTPAEILKQKNIFKISRVFENTGDDMFEGAVIEDTFAASGDICEINEVTTYSDGYVSNAYFSTDENDRKYYITYPEGSDVSDVDEEFAESISTDSFTGYVTDDFVINAVKEEEGKLEVTVEVTEEGEHVSTDVITIDIETGLIQKIVSSYPSVKGSGDSTCTYEFDYSDDLVLDSSAKTENTLTEEAGEQEDETAQAEGKIIPAGTEDMYGNPVDEAILKDAKLVMMNFWEPWCGPCVKELPDLQKLYEDYKDQGLVIIGVYTTFDEQEEAEAIIEEKGVKYPIVKCNEELSKLCQTYVPATYFMDKDGNMLTEEPYAGGRSYEEWEELIKEYLNS